MADSDTFAWQQGAWLAYEMLRRIEMGNLEDMTCDDQFRGRRPQRNIVAAYFAKLRDLRDTRCEQAFSAILTDYLATDMHSGIPNIHRGAGHHVGRPIANEVRS